MIRSYECIDNPERPIENNEILTNPKLMADYASEGRYLSLPVVPMIPICLGVSFENGRTSYPIYDDISDIKLKMDYDRAEYIAMVEALEILGPDKTVIEIRGPISCLDNLLGATKVMKAMRKKRDILNGLYHELTDIYLDYIRNMADKGVKVFSFTESILDPKVLGPREVGNYVDDFLLKFLKEVHKLANELKFTIHLCPKSSLALVDLDKAKFEPIDFEDPKKYIDILFENPYPLMGDRCINLADKEFNKVNKIVLKEN